MATIVPGDMVRTPLGKGVVQEVRYRGLLVLIGNRSVVVDARDATIGDPPSNSKRRSAAAGDPSPHGLSRYRSVGHRGDTGVGFGGRLCDSPPCGARHDAAPADIGSTRRRRDARSDATDGGSGPGRVMALGPAGRAR